MPRRRYDDDNRPYPQFESRQEARRRAYDLIDNLNRSKDETHRDLARKLDDCSIYHPCRSGACPRCMRLARSNWIDAVVALVKNEWRRS